MPDFILDFERPVVELPWYVPRKDEIELQGEKLVWKKEVDLRPPGPNSGPGRIIRQGTLMLEAFVKLADANENAYLRYACRWGLLNICKHSLPSSHNLPSPIISTGMISIFMIFMRQSPQFSRIA